jgi:hypothetical protein
MAQQGSSHQTTLFHLNIAGPGHGGNSCSTSPGRCLGGQHMLNITGPGHGGTSWKTHISSSLRLDYAWATA